MRITLLDDSQIRAKPAESMNIQEPGNSRQAMGKDMAGTALGVGTEPWLFALIL